MADDPHVSPSALNRFLGCEHRTWLDLLERRGQLDAKRRPPRMQLLFERGERFEEGVVEDMQGSGRDLVSCADGTLEERAAKTIEAMREGREVIHQACFERGGWVGYPDFLVRVDDVPSALGPWSYEVHDAKLSRDAKPDHVFQLLFYTEELEQLQGVRPARMHLLLGSGQHPAFRPHDFAAYAARVRADFEARYQELAGGDPHPAYPYPVAACEFCHWWHVCEARRRDDDHLSLVAGLQRGQGLKLEAAGVHDVAGLSRLPEDTEVPRLTGRTLRVLRDQAGLQLSSRGKEVPDHNVLEPTHDRGLGRLPAASPGDVHFDFEGDQFWGQDGLEYLFGTLVRDGDGWRYEGRWALDRAGEQAQFEAWIDWITARLERFPDLHVFHFNAYEPVALKKLVARYGTREHEVDELLRRKVFVDLYGITRQAVRVGVESYGLKALEPAYAFRRTVSIGALGRWQRWQENQDTELLHEIERYNEDDVRSTAALYDWLWSLRPEAERVWRVELSTLAPKPPKPLTDAQRAYQARVDALRPQLLDALPDDESQDTPEQRARRVAFDLVGYHRREAKPVWWELFARREMSIEQLRDEDAEAIADLTCIEVEEIGRSWQWTCAYPEQEHKIGPGGADDPVAEKGITVVSVDEQARRIVLKRGKAQGAEAPRAVAPAGPYSTDAQVEALFRFAERIAEDGLDRPKAGLDLLLRRAPRLRAGTPAFEEAPFSLERLCTQVRGLDRSVLVIQGPSGTGKTWTGARVALDLMQHGVRVGVMATSHKAINNFLQALDDAADETDRSFRGWRKKSDDPDNCYASDRIVCSSSCPDDSEGPVLVHAGTAWHWARENAAESVDVLFVDEAGQVSLADAVAVASGARNVVLLGDPQQLAHVSQGTHLHDSGVSVLQHLLGDRATVDPTVGILLRGSWRMHPHVCDFVSATMYDHLLTAEPDCARQQLWSPAGLCGTGVRMRFVEHDGNRGRSPEESQVIAEEIARLLTGARHVDRRGVERPLTLEDILVVAPYNAQVRCLRAALPDGARVGTVDKFQGQEAPVVFFSMATSTGEDASRGLSFLFSRNRLNVAISRAQALAVIVCSPRLLSARCSTVEDMRLVNLLCRAADYAAAATARATSNVSSGSGVRSLHVNATGREPLELT
jgi:predicted RecB family nuclease